MFYVDSLLSVVLHSLVGQGYNSRSLRFAKKVKNDQTLNPKNLNLGTVEDPCKLSQPRPPEP